MKKVVVAAAATLTVAAGMVSAGMPPGNHDSPVRNINGQLNGKEERSTVEKRLAEESLAEEWRREGEEYLPLPDRKKLPRGPSDSLTMLAERLGLTGDQQNRIRQILNRKVILVRTVARDVALTATQRREKAVAILEEEYAKIKKLLTEQQRKEFEEMRTVGGDARKRGSGKNLSKKPFRVHAFPRLREHRELPAKRYAASLNCRTTCSRSLAS